MTFNKNKLRKLLFLAAFCFFEGHFFCIGYVAQIDADIIKAGYAGLTSNLDFIEGSTHNFFLDVEFQEDALSLDFTGLYGKVPDKLIIRPASTVFILNNPDYTYFDFDFYKSFDSDFAFGTKAFLGNAYASQSNLYIINGNLEIPLYGGGRFDFYFPKQFDLQILGLGGRLASYNDKLQQLAKGDFSLFDIKGRKAFEFEKARNQIFYGGLGFTYLAGSVSLKADSESQNSIFFPFSYLKADATATLYFANLFFDYELTAGNFCFSFSSDFRINCRSFINYYYKYTFKKNLIFDGSIDSDYKDYDFSNGDFIYKAGLYSHYKIPQIKTKLYLNKEFIIPLITKKTKALFGFDSSEAAIDFSENTDHLLKEILLSGLTIGMKLEL